MYNFHKIKNKEGFNEFQHENFRKGKIEGLKFISRKIADTPELIQPDIKEHKNVMIESNRLKKQVLELEETLRIVSAQTKLVIDTNKDLIYKIYKSKTDNEIKIRKLLFLYFALMTNYEPELVKEIQNSLLKNTALENKNEELLFNLQNISQFVKSLSQQIFLSSEKEDNCIASLMDTFLNFHNAKEANEANRLTIDQLLNKLNLNISMRPAEEMGSYNFARQNMFNGSESYREQSNYYEKLSSLGINSAYDENSILDFDLDNFKFNMMSNISRERSQKNYDADSFLEGVDSAFNLKTPQSERMDK